MIRAVVDTNVLVSAMISGAGNEAVLLLAIKRGLVTPCFSAEILEEYSDVLTRPRFGFPGDEVEALLDLLRDRGESVALRTVPRVSSDPGDDKFIACALALKVEFLVTGNKRHFPRESIPGVKVVSAGEFLGFISVGI